MSHERSLSVIRCGRQRAYAHRCIDWKRRRLWHRPQPRRHAAEGPAPGDQGRGPNPRGVVSGRCHVRGRRALANLPPPVHPLSHGWRAALPPPPRPPPPNVGRPRAGAVKVAGAPPYRPARSPGGVEQERRPCPCATAADGLPRWRGTWRSGSLPAAMPLP
jgi:hypothetical protein